MCGTPTGSVLFSGGFRGVGEDDFHKFVGGFNRGFGIEHGRYNVVAVGGK